MERTEILLKIEQMNELPWRSPMNRWVLYITYRCNYNCAYCIQKDWHVEKNIDRIITRQFKELPGEVWVGSLASLPYRPPLAIITGGEASLHADFYEIIIGLLQVKYPLELTTNLSFDPDEFIKMFKEFDLTLPSLFTSYPPEYADPEEFISKFVKLSESKTIGKMQLNRVDCDIYPQLRSKKFDDNIKRFKGLCKKKNLEFTSAEMRSQRTADAFYRKIDRRGRKITMPMECTSGWVEIAPDGQIYNCHYHFHLGTHSFGNMQDLKNLKYMPQHMEWFSCGDYGWCDPCHENGGHGMFRYKGKVFRRRKKNIFGKYKYIL